MEKRRNCSFGAISPLYHNIFNISRISRVQLHIHLLNVVIRFIFPQFCNSDMSRYGYLEVFQIVSWNSSYESWLYKWNYLGRPHSRRFLCETHLPSSVKNLKSVQGHTHKARHRQISLGNMIRRSDTMSVIVIQTKTKCNRGTVMEQ